MWVWVGVGVLVVCAVIGAAAAATRDGGFGASAVKFGDVRVIWKVMIV